jgi:hypothetical protein
MYSPAPERRDIVIASLQKPRSQGTLARPALAVVAAVAVWLGSWLAQPAAAQAAAPDDAPAADDPIVVNGVLDIVVNGRARHCRPVPGDPLDAVNLGDGPELRAVIPNGAGGFVSALNAEQVTGPDYWQRVGVRMDEYDFRSPSNDKPMCIGGRAAPEGFAGFRRIIDAAPYRGHRLRFTAWVATGKARQVSFWLAAGTEWRAKPPVLEGKTRTRFNRLLNGGNTNAVPFGGDHGWTPVLLETGPLPDDAHHVSYGFNLQGSGDVWVYRPRLEIVDGPEDARTGDRIVIGAAQD